MYMAGKEQEFLDKITETKVEFKAAFHKRNLKPKYAVLNNIVAKCLMSTSGSLEQVSNTKIRLIAAIEDSPRVDFNWLKFLIDCILHQRERLSYSKRAFTKSRKVLYGTKISFLLETLGGENEHFLSGEKFSRNRIMFRKAKTQKRKPAVSGSPKVVIQGEPVEVESDEDNVALTEVLQTKRTLREKVKKTESAQEEEKKKKALELMRVKKEVGDRKKAQDEQKKKKKLRTIREIKAGQKSPMDTLAEAVSKAAEDEPVQGEHVPEGGDEDVFTEILTTSIGTDRITREIFSGSQKPAEETQISILPTHPKEPKITQSS